MRRLVYLLLIVVALAATASPAVAQSDDDSSIVVVALHAIPGENDFPADVYLDGELAIEGFTKMMRTDPFELTAGSVEVAVFAAGADPGTASAAVSEVIELTDAGNYALVAHLTDEGDPILAVYANDVSAIPMGQGRFVFRQTADVDAVDVVVSGEVIASGLTNTEEVVVDLAAGVHELTVVPTSGGDALVDANVELIEGELTAVFAITTTDGDVIDLAVQTVTGLESAPSMVQTGSGGFAEARPGTLVAALALAGLFAMVAAAAMLRRRTV